MSEATPPKSPQASTALKRYYVLQGDRKHCIVEARSTAEALLRARLLAGTEPHILPAGVRYSVQEMPELEPASIASYMDGYFQLMLREFGYQG